MKAKAINIIFFSCMVLMCWGQELTNNKAANLLIKSLELGNDMPKILGISQDSKNVCLVKAEIAGEIINFKFRKYDRGWSVEEFQNKLGMWVPLDDRIKLYIYQKKLRTAMKEIAEIATAIMDYLSDQGTIMPTAGTYDENSAIYRALVPNYIIKMPIKDPWGNNYLIYTGEKINGLYGLKAKNRSDFVVISLGKDGKKEEWIFLENSPEGGLFSGGEGNEDLIMFNGSWIRAPKR